jgi:hypothetical protein
MEDNVLVVEATIESDGLGGWVIKAQNKETNEIKYCKSIEEYNAFLNECTFATQKDEFQAIWNESPNATPEMIADVRAKLMSFFNKVKDM